MIDHGQHDRLGRERCSTDKTLTPSDWSIFSGTPSRAFEGRIINGPRCRAKDTGSVQGMLKERSSRLEKAVASKPPFDRTSTPNVRCPQVTHTGDTHSSRPVLFH